MEKFDSIVIGLGAMGSAAAYHLARRGQRVLGLEQFHPGHDRGSSHGETRIIRQAYFEHPNYVPLLRRAYALWEELERETGESLYVKNGMLILGNPATSEVYRGTRQSAEQYGIPLDRLTAEQSLARFPTYVPRPGMEALFEPNAGYLRVENAVKAHCRRAEALGAQLRIGEAVKGFAQAGSGVSVETERGTYTADRLVVAGGGWNPALLGNLALPLRLRRMIQCWIPATRAHEGAPCYAFSEGSEFIYGFPMLDGATIKLATHHTVDPISRPEEKDVAAVPNSVADILFRFVARSLPFARPEIVRFAPCIYTMTPDEHFLLDQHPRVPSAVFAAGFSGHGFKFASVIGEIMAELAMSGKTAQPIDFLRRREFKNAH